jgi:phage-related protein
MARLRRVPGEKPLFWVASSKEDLLAFPGAVVYVLHAFQKKSPSGIRTPRRDVDLIMRRLNEARTDFEAKHGKGEK